MSEERKEMTVELVHLDNGDIALRRSDAPEEPMVTIRFSDQNLSLVAPEKLDIARAMIEAGIHRFSEIQMRHHEESQANGAGQVLH